MIDLVTLQILIFFKFEDCYRLTFGKASPNPSKIFKNDFGIKPLLISSVNLLYVRFFDTTDVK
jgi:hypothetical protein